MVRGRSRKREGRRDNTKPVSSLYKHKQHVQHTQMSGIWYYIFNKSNNQIWSFLQLNITDIEPYSRMKSLFQNKFACTHLHSERKRTQTHTREPKHTHARPLLGSVLTVDNSDLGVSHEFIAPLFLPILNFKTNTEREWDKEG